ncbi:MAG: TRZ/ATZ family hydrolase [Proteobacteria bacterium]|nr:TRZ/ATZ family hydrolase [Pseudomonadota bacterium]
MEPEPLSAARRTVDLRIDAAWIAPVEPEAALAEHALLVDGGRIVALAPWDEADARYVARVHVQRLTHVLIPGLVNAHAHSAMALMRGVADDVPLAAWLTEHIWPREAAVLGPDFVHDGTLLAAAEMLAGGITACNDMYFYPEAAADAYLAAGMRAMLGVPVLDFPTRYAPDAAGYLAAGLAARDRYRREPHIVFSLAPHAPYTVGDDSWRAIVTLARELDLTIQTHLLETRKERADALTQDGRSPLARLDALGATGPGFVAIHAVHCDEDDIRMLAARHCHVVHCPASNAKLASGIAPVAAYLAAGINVALGTDGAASNNRLDLMGEMRLAALLAKATTGDAAALPAASVLRCATLGGARALGLDATIGSLVPGKAADAVAIDLADIATTPCYDPVSHLVHAAGREHVTDVWVDGAPVVTDRLVQRIDVAAVKGSAERWHARLARPPG